MQSFLQREQKLWKDFFGRKYVQNGSLNCLMNRPRISVHWIIGRWELRQKKVSSFFSAPFINVQGIQRGKWLHIFHFYIFFQKAFKQSLCLGQNCSKHRNKSPTKDTPVPKYFSYLQNQMSGKTLVEMIVEKHVVHRKTFWGVCFT